MLNVDRRAGGEMRATGRLRELFHVSTVREISEEKVVRAGKSTIPFRAQASRQGASGAALQSWDDSVHLPLSTSLNPEEHHFFFFLSKSPSSSQYRTMPLLGQSPLLLVVPRIRGIGQGQCPTLGSVGKPRCPAHGSSVNSQTTLDFR